MCLKYIGGVPPKNALVGSTLKLKWLKENMLTLPAKPTPQQLAIHCRAYILGLIGGVLMLNKSGNRVHLMYLPLLVDIDRVGRYNWGLACVVHLYKEMYREFIPHPKNWEDVHYCCSLGHGIACCSFNQGSSANNHIHLQLGKQKFLT